MLEHTRTGSGPPIVLMHGIGLDRRIWDPVVPLLAREHEVVAVDLPGFGESAPLSGTPTVEALAWRGARRSGTFVQIGESHPPIRQC